MEEFVSAYQLIRNCKVKNDMSVYETIIRQAAEMGLKETEVRQHLEYTILTDFLLTNTDRHFNNFGFLYDPAAHKLSSMAPIFDTGNALFYNEEIIPMKNNLLDIKVTSFSNKEVNMFRYITEKNLIDLKNQENYIKVQQKKIPYRRVISLSSDLLAGKRENVLNTAVQHYYRQACAVAEGMAAAEEYRSRNANKDLREIAGNAVRPIAKYRIGVRHSCRYGNKKVC